jgi:hypothetical protein
VLTVLIQQYYSAAVAWLEAAQRAQRFQPVSTRMQPRQQAIVSKDHPKSSCTRAPFTFKLGCYPFSKPQEGQ